MKYHFLAVMLAACFILGCDQVGKTHSNKKEVTAGASHPFSSGNNWSGYYQTKSRLCTAPDDSGSCAEKFRDCLRIQPSRDGYQIQLHSTQAYQHVCAFSIEMKEIDGKLVFNSPFGPVSILRRSNELVIASAGIDPTAAGLGVCGAHADIDALTFPLSEKIEASTQCFRGEP